MAFAHFGSLGHILVILAILQTYSLLLYLLWSSLSSDFRCYVQKDYDSLKVHKIEFFSNTILIKVCTFPVIMLLHT